VRPEVASTAQAMAMLGPAAAAPRAAYRRLRVTSCTPEGLVLAPGTRFQGPTFQAALGGECEEVIVFVLSLGARFDTTQHNLAASGKSLEAYMLELAGWLAIEEATRRFKRHLQAEVAPEGLALTRRMAPGYATRVDGAKVEWPLEDQRALFSLFEPEGLPARLVEDSCAMTPKMSRTGLFGLVHSRNEAAPEETQEDE
jgi:hypothetical protein